MTFAEAALLGLVQGGAEWLPQDLRQLADEAADSAFDEAVIVAPPRVPRHAPPQGVPAARRLSRLVAHRQGYDGAGAVQKRFRAIHPPNALGGVPRQPVHHPASDALQRRRLVPNERLRAGYPRRVETDGQGKRFYLIFSAHRVHAEHCTRIGSRAKARAKREWRAANPISLDAKRLG